MKVSWFELPLFRVFEECDLRYWVLSEHAVNHQMAGGICCDLGHKADSSPLKRVWNDEISAQSAADSCFSRLSDAPSSWNCWPKVLATAVRS